MMKAKSGVSNHRKWAEFRLAVIGSLLADPPEHGALKAAIEKLASKQWRHPFTGNPASFSFGTIERWYYLAKDAQSPVEELIKKARGDLGQRKLEDSELAKILQKQYQDHPGWSRRLHFDNLATLAEQNQSLGSMPSYASLCRWMREKAYFRIRLKRP